MITITIPKTGDVEPTNANMSELLFCCIFHVGYLRINIQVCKNDIGDGMQITALSKQQI